MDRLSQEMWMIDLMSQVMHLGMGQTKKLLGQHDLKPWQAGILMILDANPGMSQKELAKKMNITPSSITTAIQKMERLEFITRQPDEQDQRILRLYLTEKSREYKDKILESGRQLNEIAFQGFSIEEKIVLKRLLMQVKQNYLDAGAEFLPPHPMPGERECRFMEK